MDIIGLNGPPRAGKDTVGKILSQHGYKRVGFADKLKEAVEALDPYMGNDRRLSYYIDLEMDWEELKDTYPEARRLLQYMGTEVGRNIFGENFWVDLAFKSCEGEQKVVFSDCRFPSEYIAIRNHGGRLWRINRQGFGPVNNHVSETALDNYNFDNYIQNDGTLEDLTRTVNDIV